MESRTFRRGSLLLAGLLTVGCGATAKLTIPQTTGPEPALAAPNTTLIPTINVVEAKGWPDHRTTPIATTGTTVAAFARDLDHPRWLYVLPNGDVLVAETNAPPRPEDGKGSKVGSSSAFRARPVAQCPARTASRCCATRIATASQTSERLFSVD